ncbi:MAG: hypothetical protein MJ185_06985 [Treponema sp.]|nr:hypothetical protein [Treponema sp.]
MAKKQFAVTILTFSLLSGILFAEGSNVLSLSQIDVLIKETKYDQALEELNRYIAQNPENFDNAQTRIDRIMNARNRYTQLAEQLIQLIIDEPDNSEKIYRVTSELEHLEKYPSDRQLAFIRETRIAAEFNFFRKEYNRIHEETEELVQKGNYVLAAKKAREGFTLYQERFFDEWQQDDVVGPVKDALAKIDETLLAYEQGQKTLEDSVTAFVRSVNDEKQEDIEKNLQTVQGEFAKFAKLRNTIYESGDKFKTTFEYTKELTGEDLTDASFLPFVSRFTTGQADKTDTGIAGAMDNQWNNNIDRMKKAIDGKLNGYVLSFAGTLPESIVSAERESLGVDRILSIRQFSNLAVKVNNLNSQLSPEMNEETNRLYDIERRYAYDLPVKIENLYSVKNQLEERIQKYNSITIPENPSEIEMTDSRFSSSYLSAVAVLDFSDEEKKAFSETLNAEIQDPVLQDMTGKYTAYISELQNQADVTITKANRVFCDYVTLADEGYVTESKNDFSAAELLLNGTENPENIILEKYPEKAQSAADSLNGKIDRQILVIRRHIALLPDLREKQMASETETSLLDFIARLENQKKESNELIALCRVQIQNSQRAKNEAELRLNQAEIALQTDNFETARKRLQDSRTKYNEALALSFSKELQNESDVRLIQLGEKINQKENEIVVRDVRNLKTQAKNEYYAGNFEQAENLLTQASARWSVTNVDDDLEINSLRALVNTALSMKTGRTILPSAPLYPEMSQILSVAASYYAEGENYLERGNREEGIKSLEAALQKIQEVQLVYPLNQEASLLSLRIQKVISPDDFDQMFSRKVSEAKANYKEKSKQQETYADLLDLYELNPKYPGLKDLIYNVELEIGIRQKPVTKSVSNKSQDLTKEAQNIYNKAKGDEDELRRALAKLDEAISLNENNTTAIALKDKIQIAIGGKASAVLSAEDESRYQTAIQELQSNNIIAANAIVEQLLQKSSNKNSTKILELRKKIKALL